MMLSFSYTSGQVWSIVASSALIQLTRQMQQITPVIVLFYDAPTRPVGVFDDFLAIQPAQGNVSTQSYPDYVLNANSFASSANTGARLVYVTLWAGR